MPLPAIVQSGNGNIAGNTQAHGSSAVAALIVQSGNGNSAANIQGDETLPVDARER